MLLVIVAALFLGQSLFFTSSIYEGYINEPEQADLIPPVRITIQGKDEDVDVKLLAKYELKGIVKGKKKYYDYSSEISSYDIAIAWGDLNTKEMDKYIKYSQSGRWYYFTYSAGFPMDEAYIIKNSANVHLVHADGEVLKKIKKIRKGTYVILDGYLIEAEFENGPWRSSLVRTDTGNGACEIMYVTDIKIIH
ncbi:MAG: hypothetical protein RBT15_10010 [Gudongella sp.]|nr:hypothetical protein [Gudongella sp.]